MELRKLKSITMEEKQEGWEKGIGYLRALNKECCEVKELKKSKAIVCYFSNTTIISRYVVFIFCSLYLNFVKYTLLSAELSEPSHVDRTKI